MSLEDSPLDRTPDLVATIRALRDQAEKEMNRFTSADNYDIRRVVGRKPKTEASVPAVTSPRKKQSRKAEQTSIDFAPASEERGAREDEQA
jgi:hypothetical protein